MNEAIAYIEFVDGTVRPDFESDGRQYVLADEGEPVCGVWFIPREECDQPIVVSSSKRLCCPAVCNPSVNPAGRDA